MFPAFSSLSSSNAILRYQSIQHGIEYGKHGLERRCNFKLNCITRHLLLTNSANFFFYFLQANKDRNFSLNVPEYPVTITALALATGNFLLLVILIFDFVYGRLTGSAHNFNCTCATIWSLQIVLAYVIVCLNNINIDKRVKLSKFKALACLILLPMMYSTVYFLFALMDWNVRQWYVGNTTVIN